MVEHPGRIRLDPERCVAARRRSGLSRAALVDRAEPDWPISEATVKRAEKGAPINLEKAGTLARLLGVPLTELLPPSEAKADPEPPPSPPKPTPAASSERLVNRRSELTLFETAYDEAEAGLPRVVLLEGAPGIGKSRLLREVRRRWRDRGGLDFAGVASEQRSAPLSAVAAALAERVDDLATFADEDAALLDGFAQRGEIANEHALFVALARTLRRSQRPLLFALDDLQWADTATLELLEHTTRAAFESQERGEPARVVFVGSFREPAADSHLEVAVGRLARESRCERRNLGPLDEADTYDLVTTLGIESPSSQLVNSVCDATQGNPLFVREMVELLRERDELIDRSGFAALREPIGDLALPRDVTGTIAARFDDLSRECQRSLKCASLLAGRFDLDKLAAASGEDPDELLDLLEEAVDAGFVENRGDLFAFHHAEARRVVEGRMIPARRRRLHREIADRLESHWAGEIEEHVGEIAEHWRLAGVGSDTRRRAAWLVRAAEEALSAERAEEATHFGVAILDTDTQHPFLAPAERAEWLRRTGVAMNQSWDLGPSLALYDESVELFRSLGDVVGAGRALKDRVRLMAIDLGRRDEETRRDIATLEELLDDLRDGGHALLAGQVLDTLASCAWAVGDVGQTETLAREALDIGEKLGDDDLCAQVSTALALAHLQRGELDSALERWRTGQVFAQRAGDPRREGRCLQRLPMVLQLQGRVDESLEAAEEAWIFTQEIRNSGESSLPRAVQAVLAVIRGDFDEADSLAEETIRLVDRYRYAWAGPSVFPALACARALRGDSAGARDALQRWCEPGSVHRDPERLEPTLRLYGWLIDSWYGIGGESAAVVHSGLEHGARRLEGEVRIDPWSVGRRCAEIELAFALQAPELAAPRIPTLERAREAGMVATQGWVHSIPRVLGVAHTLAGDWSAAESRFEESARWAEANSARPEWARTHLDWARAIAGRGGQTAARAALEHARRAEALLAELEMPPFEREVQRLLGALGAR